ncbi:MAG: Crp/Fnr family transcriptional regulator [Pseudomonadota bacterium]
MYVERVLLNREGGELSDKERRVLESAIDRISTFDEGDILVRQGAPVSTSTLLLEGFITRHIDDPSGRRHLVAMHVPGDFVDLHGYALKRLDHDLGALTPVKVAVVPHAALEQIQEEMVHLTRRLWFLTLLDAAIHRQRIYRQTSLNATARVCHFLCETNARLLAIGESDGNSFRLPMTQGDLGEVCGLTNVHVNRVVRELREMQLCTFRASIVELHDLPALATLGQFDAHYLYLNGPTARLAMGQAEKS